MGGDLVLFNTCCRGPGEGKTGSRQEDKSVTIIPRPLVWHGRSFTLGVRNRPDRRWPALPNRVPGLRCHLFPGAACP